MNTISLNNIKLGSSIGGVESITNYDRNMFTPGNNENMHSKFPVVMSLPSEVSPKSKAQ